MDATPYTVLVVDRDVTLRRAFERALTPLGYRVLATGNPDTAYALLSSEVTGAVLLDAHLQAMSGLAFYLAIVHRWPRLAGRIAVLAAGDDTDDVRRWLALHGCTVFWKPFQLERIADWLEAGRQARERASSAG